MDGQRRLGAILLAVGGVIAAVGLGGVVLSGGGTTTGALPSPTAAPIATTTEGTPGAAEATPSPSTPPSIAPSPSASPDEAALVRAFLAELQAAIRAGTVATLVDRLDPAVIERYGLDQCREQLEPRSADPAWDAAVRTVQAAAPWEYALDERTTTIPRAIAVDVSLTVTDDTGQVATADRTLHFNVVDGQVTWFTDCGTPAT